MNKHTRDRCNQVAASRSQEKGRGGKLMSGLGACGGDEHTNDLKGGDSLSSLRVPRSKGIGAEDGAKVLPMLR